MSILLYADDIALVCNTEADLQCMLDKVHSWCRKWRMKINRSKTSVIHFRKQSEPKTDAHFKCGEDDIDIVPEYKYLGCILNEHVDFKTTADTLASSAGRALGSIINTCLKENSLQYNTFTKLFQSCVVPIMDYGAGVWGYPIFDKPNTIQNRAIRAFLGTHRFTSNVAIQGDMGWTFPVVRRRLCILRMWNRLLTMDEFRLKKESLYGTGI